MKFLCSNCFYEKEIPPEAEAKYAGKNVACPKCKLKSKVEQDVVTVIHAPPPIAVVAKRKRWPLICGWGVAIAAVVIFVVSMPRRSIPATFSESVDVDAATSFTAAYHNEKIYIPINTDYYQCIPYVNRWIQIDIVRNGKRIEPTAGLFDIDGKPTELTCKSSNNRICECSVI